MGNERIRLIIRGRVQGVFFRASTSEKASELGLSGWVRNRADGAVEVVAEGEKKVLEQFIVWCRVGPKHARVDDVEIEWGRYTGEFREFKVKYGEI